jgi:hypothetical protein
MAMILTVFLIGRSIEIDLSPDESLRAIHSNGSDSVLPQVLGNLITANIFIL